MLSVDCVIVAHTSGVKGGGPSLHLYSLLLEPLREELNKYWDGVEGRWVYGLTQVLQESKLPASLLALCLLGCYSL